MPPTPPKETKDSFGHADVRSVDDPATVDACRRGDRNALGRVYMQHSPALERLLTRLLGPTADVEDALQQTFIAATAAFSRFRGEASVRTWLGRIAVNQALEALRKPERKRRVSLEVVMDRAVAADVAIDRSYEAKRRLERMYTHLDSLSPKQRVAFVLHVIDGHPIEEVTALMGAGVAATKSRVMWARRTLIKKAQRDPLLCDLVAGGSA